MKMPPASLGRKNTIRGKCAEAMPLEYVQKMARDVGLALRARAGSRVIYANWNRGGVHRGSTKSVF